MKNITIAEFTKTYRLEKGLTQTDLADLLGVSVGYVCNVEKGRHVNAVTFCTRLKSILSPAKAMVLERIKKQAIAESLKIRERQI